MTSRRELDVTDFFFQIEPTLGGNIFVSDFFFDLSGVQADFFPDNWNKIADFWESALALDRSDRLLSGLLRAFSYDRFKIYLIVPIVWIELNSIQAIEVVSDVWVVWDRPGSVPHLVVPIVWTLFETAWDDRDDHMHGKQALASCSL